MPRGADEANHGRYGISHNVYYVLRLLAWLARLLPQSPALLRHGA